MKIAFVRLQGFRGFLQPTFLEFSPSFVVISGRNGSGKSTLCDAIEFALTGTVRGGSAHKERGEDISDYYWWRGAAPAPDSFVELGLRSEDGELLTIRRTPRSETGIPPALHAKLVNERFQVDDALARLCSTSIIRDEWITTASVDLQEADRYRLVREALGTYDVGQIVARAQATKEILEAQVHVARRAYEEVRSRVVGITEALSVARAAASEAPAVNRASRELAALTNAPPSDTRGLIHAAEAILAQTRLRLSKLTQVQQEIRLHQKQQMTFLADKDSSALERTRTEINELEERQRLNRENLARLDAELAAGGPDEPTALSLAQLLVHGRQLGLRNGRCPLCSTKHTPEEFADALTKLAGEISASQQDRASAISRYREAAAAISSTDAAIAGLRKTASFAEARALELDAGEKAIRGAARNLIEVEGSDLESLSSILTEEASRVRATIASTEVALAEIRSSQASEQVIGLESELKNEEAASLLASNRVSAAEKALATASAALRIIPRVQGEVVAEQLGALSPLLVDLYSRLRPHLDWRRIKYNLRGDVRRLLSLEVGEGLNPSFVFSSGQRRAVGLAFLLAVHLSRGWSNLQSLILDDPMQHIDDYRALHLVEVLSAVRKTGRQVICTSEDGELAKFLARRLQGYSDAPGVLAELQYRSGEGAQISQSIEVPLLRKRFLVAS